MTLRERSDSKGRKAVVFGNGDLVNLAHVRTLIDADTLLIGCDGGAAHVLSLGLTPHAVIGDFDSISAKVMSRLKKRKVECIRYPRDKIYTDTELGVALAKERGCKEIILTGIRGSSSDHFLGNLFLLAKKRFAKIRMRIIEGKEEIELVRKRLMIEGKKGETVSLVPLGPDARGVTTKGLFYPLKNAVLQAGSSRGIRNHMTGKHAEVSVRKGTLLVIHER